MATHRCPFCKSTIPESKPAADLPVYSKAKISEQSYKGFVYLAIGRIAVTWGTPLFFYVLHRFGIIRNRDAAILGVVFVEHFVWFYSYFLDYCLLERSVVKTAYHCPNCGESAVGGRLEYLSGNCCSCGARLYSDRPSLETGEIKSLPGAEKFQRWRRCLEFLRGVVVKLPAILMIAVGIIAIYGGFSFKGVIGISLLAFALAGMIKSKICKFLQRKAKKELHCPYCSTDSNTNSAFAIDMAWLIAERCPSCGRKLS